jgi:hypothetical protein
LIGLHNLKRHLHAAAAFTPHTRQSEVGYPQARHQLARPIPVSTGTLSPAR